VTVQHRDEKEKREYSDRLKDEETLPAALKEPGVTAVLRDFRIGKQIVVFLDGRRETRSMPTSAMTVPHQLENPKTIVAALELKHQAREKKEQQEPKKTPKGIVEALERRFGLAQPVEVEPLSDAEYERFQTPFIAKPTDHDLRLQARTNKQKRELIAKRADISRQQEQAKKEEARRLFGPGQRVARLRAD
jgi:hypothetical protein